MHGLCAAVLHARRGVQPAIGRHVRDVAAAQTLKTSCFPSSKQQENTAASREFSKMGKGGRKWYAVACGRTPGVYEDWHACQDQVKGYSGALYKSFTSKQEAQQFCGERGAQFFDGGSRGNPGPAGCGAAVFAGEHGAGAPIATGHAYIGHATNNQAEYEGLILGLGLALQHGAQSVTVRGDSMLVVNQVNNTWRATNPGMKHLLEVVQTQMLPRFKHWEIIHVYRNENGEADRLANQAMDSRHQDTLPSKRSW